MISIEHGFYLFAHSQFVSCKNVSGRVVFNRIRLFILIKVAKTRRPKLTNAKIPNVKDFFFFFIIGTRTKRRMIRIVPAMLNEPVIVRLSS